MPLLSAITSTRGRFNRKARTKRDLGRQGDEHAPDVGGPGARSGKERAASGGPRERSKGKGRPQGESRPRPKNSSPGREGKGAPKGGKKRKQGPKEEMSGSERLLMTQRLREERESSPWYKEGESLLNGTDEPADEGVALPEETPDVPPAADEEGAAPLPGETTDEGIGECLVPGGAEEVTDEEREFLASIFNQEIEEEETALDRLIASLPDVTAEELYDELMEVKTLMQLRYDVEL